ncbi:MAG TPA: polysaccharide deacetylase family protein [Burkholderiales bacterium]|nr:polysaccharide deacetylase family protein [Burkholderiales bacterium]
MKFAPLPRYVVLALLLAACFLIYRYFIQNPGPDGRYRVNASQVHVFAGVSGPAESTPVAAAVQTNWQSFSQGGPSRLAVLLTEDDSSWLGLIHGLKTIGVPFIVTRDYREAIKHKVVYVYPSLTGRSLPVEGLQALARLPREGGTLIAQHVLGGELNEVFGFGEALPADGLKSLRIDTRHSLTAEFVEPEEREFLIGAKQSQTRGTYFYSDTRQMPLATYEDGSTAIARKDYEHGHAYAFGVDLGHLLLKGHNGRQEGLSEHIANRYTPNLDVLLRLVRNIYREGEDRAVILGTVPQGKSLSILITHDVDYTRSIKNALDYAAMEKAQGLSATYFIQTKYVRDWNDDVIFDEEGIAYIRRLREFDMETASHSVSHARSFATFPVGDGAERYPDYLPFVKNHDEAYNGSVLGELRVSRFLLEHFSGARVQSFRSGYLALPFDLPQALEATGYRFSSTLTANLALTHLPYRANRGRSTRSESTVFEFPVTVEDELDAPMINRLPQAIELARKLEAYGGLFVLLIHPDVLDQKLEFERRLIEALRDKAWFGSMATFGEWWATRDGVQIDAERDATGLRIRIHAPAPIEGLVLQPPAGLRCVASSGAVLGRGGLNVPAGNSELRCK